MTDLFTHWVDVVHWAMNSDTPQVAQTLGNGYLLTDWECPDTILASFQYPKFMVVYDGTMICSLEDGGLVFRGTQAMMKLDRLRLSVYPEGGGFVVAKTEPTVDIPSKEDGTIAHMRNFLDCIRSGKRPNADIEEGHKSTRLCHLGNIAYRTGRTLHFDAATEAIRADAEANRLLGRTYRKAFAVPQRI